MNFQGNSQSTLMKESRVKSSISSDGDTLISFSIKDAKIILADLLTYRYNDEILTQYIYRDSVKTDIIVLSKEQINNLTEQNDNLETIISNLNLIIENKDREIEIINEKLVYKDKLIKKHILHKKILIGGFVIIQVLLILILT